ncbi:MAG: ROK family protein [Clostridia bacterium]|nr:ROK family protein [Clostridia bacterium]
MGLVDNDGRISYKKIVKLDETNRSEEGIFNCIREYVDEHAEKADSVGIGVPGIIRNNQIIYTANLPLQNVDVASYVGSRLPLYVGNDASCATIAEYHFIDKKMYSNYALVTIGTGIGAGIILNGNLYNGSTGAAGEVGHMVIDKDGIQCNCGRRGCYEKYGSISSLLKKTNTESLKEFFYLLDRNENIGKVFDEYLENVAEGLANIINLYDLEMLVIGGGIAWFSDKFIHTLKSKVASKILNRYTYDLNMRCAELGNDAGIIGASLLSQYEE